MRISDWSSDVCSSDLAEPPAVLRQQTGIPGQPVEAAADPGRIPEGEVRAARVPQLRRLPGGAAPAAVEVDRHQHFEVVVLRQAVELLPVEAGAQRVPGAGEQVGQREDLHAGLPAYTAW